MAVIKSAFAKRRLREGTDERLLDIEIGDIYTGNNNGETAIRLVFSNGTSLEDAVQNRDRVRENFYRLVQALGDEDDAIVPFFEVGEQRDFEAAETY